jgi:hypothetical protein
MKRIHYLLLGLLVSLTLAAVSPTLPPTRIIAGSNVTVTTNGVNNFTIASSSGGISALNQNQFDSSSTNIKSGALTTNLNVKSSAAGVDGLVVNTNFYVTTDGYLQLPAGDDTHMAVRIGDTNTGFYKAFSGGVLGLAAGGTVVMGFPRTADKEFTNLKSTKIGWVSSDGGAFATALDTALARNAAGVVEINSGTAAAYRDLKLRTGLYYASPSDPSSSATFGQVYAKTNGATTEVYVMDGAGNVTQISPHARQNSPAPASLDAGDKTPIVIHHKNVFTGEQEWLHLSALAKEVEKLSGKKFVFKSRIPNSDVRDWDAEQAREEAEHEAARSSEQKNLQDWNARTELEKGPKPAVRDAFKKLPKPDFLK